MLKPTRRVDTGTRSTRSGNGNAGVHRSLTTRAFGPALWSLSLVLGAFSSAHAEAHHAHEGLRRPARVTVGIADQFLGQLAPDERTLYFVSSRETRSEIFTQDLHTGRVQSVFDERADVTWPRVSPNGRSLLYISFGNQATGQLCVRSLPEGDARRCLDRAPASLQAEWIDDQRIVLVGRTSIHGDLRVSEVNVGEELSARTLFDKNWTHPTVSPDGRWLLYVPVDRTEKLVGPGFAARATGRLEAVRLDGKGRSVPVKLDLPGLSGQPAFARDGRFLYFVQFFADSNHDGLIDASDHGVLFRVPWARAADDAPLRVADAVPLQLTDSGSDCQYPAPSAHRLITTCLHGHDLDVYQLPLDGELPTEWDTARLKLEILLGARRDEQLLLYRHLLVQAPSQFARRLIEMRLVTEHLALEEFNAAQFYAEKVNALHEPKTRGIGQPLLALVAQRRARGAQERGRMIDTFADEARARMEQLQDDPNDSQAARVLNRVVRSEIADALGDKATARHELESAELDADGPEIVLEAYLARADALYRELDDREALVAVYRRCARSNGFGTHERLKCARAATRALIRGLAFAQAEQVLQRARAAEAGDTELGFALELMQAALAVRTHLPPPEVKARLVALYVAQERRDRKRAVVLEGLQHAAEVSADEVIEALSALYVDDVPKGTEERLRAERIYRRALLGRAFRRLEAQDLDGARKDFDDVYRRTGSFEAVVGSIDVRMRQGERPREIARELDGDDRTSPHTHFVLAYLIALDLERLSGNAHREALAEARELLQQSWSVLEMKPAARALYGSIMHEDYLRTFDLAAAEEASAHYMVALGLAHGDPRYEALLLGQLGLLHGQVKNFRISLDYLERRAELPFDDDVEAFAVRLMMARARLHVGADKDAAASGDAALAVLGRVPSLAKYRVLALDQAALCHLSADHFERALALYDAELPLIADAPEALMRRNRFVVRLARAAAAQGAGKYRRTLNDLDAIEPSLKDRAFVESLTPEYTTPEHVRRSYTAITAGLRANASLGLGQRREAQAALERQRAIFLKRMKTSDRVEDARAVILVETRLAENASARGDQAWAARWLTRALEHADRLRARRAAPVDIDQLHVLRVAAELALLERVPMRFDLKARLSAATAKLAKLNKAKYRGFQRWFEIYLAMLENTSS